MNFTVNQSGDAGDLTCDATCTLRDAIDDANNLASDDAIGFDAGVTNIVLANEIAIADNGTLAINGPGANVLTIDGGAGSNRIFAIDAATATITGVTLTGGNGNGLFFPDSGGAIFANGGTLVLNGVHVTGNTVLDGGGGVFIDGGANHQILNSTFSANTAVNCGGFIAANGTTVFSVANSTVSGNTAAGGTGGGLCLDGNSVLRGVTVTANSATSGVGQGGGIFTFFSVLDLGNTIIAGNTAAFSPEIGTSGGTITTAGYNLIGNNSSVETEFPAGNPNGNQDIVGTPASPVDPLVGPLANYGGSTPTHNLALASPAVDKGNSFGLTTDQRGFARPIDLFLIANNPTGDASDIGAYEIQGPTAAAVSINGRITTAGGRGIGNVRISLADAGGNVRYALSSSFGYFKFEDVAAGGTYVISVNSKRYRFDEPSRVLNLFDDAYDVNFVAGSTF